MNETRLEIYFATPLRLEFPPKRTYKGILNLTTDSMEIKGENMATTVQVGHLGEIDVTWVDESGKSAKVDGLTTWATTDSTIVTVQVATGNSQIANWRTVAIGTAQIQASADADMGEGVKTITSTMDFTVIGGEAVGGQMQVQDLGPIPGRTTK